MTENSTLPEWARQSTLGIFVHWGPYSVPAWAEPTGAWGAVPEEKWFAHNAYAEWYANTSRIEGSPAALHHVAEYGNDSYDAFLDRWVPDQFDPSEWARLFRRAGADYVIPVAKHHDGVTLWDAPGAGRLSTVARGPRLDLIAPLADAVREEGMRFGVYYSGGLDWAFTNFPPIESMADVTKYRPNDEAYAAYATAHVRDLIDRYKPSVIWNDIEWPDAGKADGSLGQLLEHYKRVVPEGIVNDRWGSPVWDYRTSEYSHDTHNERGIGWEHNRGLGFSFGYNRVEDESLTLSSRELARLYADVVSRGGRLLLNIGPEASGRIPDVQLRTLRGFGDWILPVKPSTVFREPVERNLLTVSGAQWWVAWRNGDDVIVIVDTDSAVVRAEDASPVTVFALPAG
ncbi:alpha-L-fucosidase [Microbacterium foliorum]|uniref:alpha-L-fucosidase n=1 Tax=Microbacterium foliorum TaxID=104336 RepID=UPI0020A22501|nr:alpha-L-fucosidase [Microbacterium foliorum]MCP1428170.1 alpha-L-fucosidase [Microbacterium foliorum]